MPAVFTVLGVAVLAGGEGINWSNSSMAVDFPRYRINMLVCSCHAEL